MKKYYETPDFIAIPCDLKDILTASDLEAQNDNLRADVFARLS